MFEYLQIVWGFSPLAIKTLVYIMVNIILQLKQSNCCISKMREPFAYVLLSSILTFTDVSLSNELRKYIQYQNTKNEEEINS